MTPKEEVPTKADMASKSKTKDLVETKGKRNASQSVSKVAVKSKSKVKQN